MKHFLVLLDYDGTLVERTHSTVLDKIPFQELEAVRKKYRVEFNIEFEYRIVTSSCAKSIEDIMTMSEMSMIDEWMFENGLHVRRYKDFYERVVTNPQTTAFNARRQELVQSLKAFCGPDFHAKIETISEKKNSVAIHCDGSRDEIFAFLSKEASAFADVIQAGLQTIELFPKDSNKSRILDQVEEGQYDRIIFFGDSIYKHGNDYEIAHHKKVDIAIEVKNGGDSAKVLANMQRIHDRPLSASILNGTQARVVRDREQLIENGDALFQKKQYILLDFDGTLTYEKGQLHPGIVSVLNDLKPDYKIWIITGRSKGWADMMIHTLPIDGVIGENGAFAYYKDTESEKINFWQSKHLDPAYKQKINQLKSHIKSQFRSLTFASDQFSREYDLAAVTDEHGTHLSKEQVQELVIWAKRHGAEAVISNIHVNMWFGAYNKAQSVIDLFSEIYGVSTFDLCRKSFYIGDSPNDEPMFRLISASFGVKNVEAFLPILRYPPAVISDRPEGFGACDILLSIKEKRKVKIRSAI